jgi:hypothetical protein
MPSISPIDIHVGRGDIWITTTPPATPPVDLTGGVPADGYFIGATIGPSAFHYRPATLDIKTQQDTGIVGFVITEEDTRLDFEVGEFTYASLRDFWLGGVASGTYITFGSQVFPNTFSVLIIAPKRSGGGAFIEVMLYNAIFAEERTLSFDRAGITTMKVVARAQSDLTRAQGDRQGFVHPNVVSA